MDDTTVQWDQARFEEIKGKITPFLKALGFNPKTDLTFIPVSAQMGENMKAPIGKTAPWYEYVLFLFLSHVLSSVKPRSILPFSPSRFGSAWDFRS